MVLQQFMYSKMLYKKGYKNKNIALLICVERQSKGIAYFAAYLWGKKPVITTTIRDYFFRSLLLERNSELPRLDAS